MFFSIRSIKSQTYPIALNIAYRLLVMSKRTLALDLSGKPSGKLVIV